MLIPSKIGELKGSDLRNAYHLNLRLDAEYNDGKSVRQPIKGLKMYAELKLNTCPRCGIPKSIEEFGKDATNAKGISSWCKPCKKQWRADWRKSNPEKARARDFKDDLKRHYGVTVEQYNTLYQAQKGRCACCGIHESHFKRGLHVDHCHKNGEIRALLCTKCNPGLGYFGHSIEALEAAIAYLKKFKK